MKKHLWLVLLLGCFTTNLFGQSLQQSNKERLCCQTVVIKYQNNIYELYREGPLNGQYGEWGSQTPWPVAVQKTVTRKRWPAKQESVKFVMGDAMWKHFTEYNVAAVSGHFNYSKDPRYDFRAFAGQSYGTWLTKTARAVVAPRTRVPPIRPSGGG